MNRRRWLRLAAAALPALARASQTVAEKPLTFPGKRPLLVHNDFPEDLETPVEYFDTWITPNDAFFVRHHFPRPRPAADAFRLRLDGMVAQPVTLTLEELKALPRYTVPATLECAGNGRGNFRPRMPGLQWTKGAIGNAQWTGVRLKDLLHRVQPAAAARYVTCDGADTGVGKTPDFIRSIPLGKAMHDATLVALEMNGEPLPALHGFPARLIVPGWDGASWVKWLTRLSVAEQPDGGFYMNPAYRYPRRAVAPGTAARPEDMEVIEGMTVKSFFVRPADGAKLPTAPVTLAGVAWAGEERITRVEVSIDGGSRWRDAELGAQDFPFCWRLWRFTWKPAAAGYYSLLCRATDSAGRTQPIHAAWNPSGYLWNAIERIGVLVEG